MKRIESQRSKITWFVRMIAVICALLPGLLSAGMSDYKYTVSTTNAVCGSDGVVSLHFEPDDANHQIKFTIAKCSGTFTQSGTAILFRDGAAWKTGYTYNAGQSSLVRYMDPYANGILGIHTYKAGAGPTGYEYVSGEITAVPEFATSCEAKKDGVRWTSVGIYHYETTGNPDGYGYFKIYVPEGYGNWYFYAQKMTGYTITANYSYSEVSGKYRFFVPTGADIVVNYTPVAAPELDLVALSSYGNKGVYNNGSYTIPGQTDVGVTKTQSFLIQNFGDAALTIGTITLNPTTHFSMGAYNSTISAGITVTHFKSAFSLHLEEHTARQLIFQITILTKIPLNSRLPPLLLLLFPYLKLKSCRIHIGL